MSEVIVQLKGGLGNQLFQYACGRALAIRCNTHLKLDASSFIMDLKRSYKLDHFRIKAMIAKPQEVALLKDIYSRRNTFRVRISRLVYGVRSKNHQHVFVDDESGYNPAIQEIFTPVYLIGYWQSEKYFKDVESAIRNEITWREPPSNINFQLLHQIGQVESTSLHIRRGDYLSDPNVFNRHGICPLSYYENAVRLLSTKVSQPEFFVFSDDIEWVKKNLRIGYPTNFINHNGVDRDYEDLRLMSRCKNHIIANSSFSWWGAWLSTNVGKIVIAPREWYVNPAENSSDLIPNEWIKL